MNKHKQNKWFIKVRGSYLPNSWQGWLTYIPYTVYVAAVLIYVIMHNTDLWQAAFVLIPNWIAALAIMTWVAKAKS